MPEWSNSLDAILQLGKVFDESPIGNCDRDILGKRILGWQLETDQLPQPSCEGPPRILIYPCTWQGGDSGEWCMPL